MTNTFTKFFFAVIIVCVSLTANAATGSFSRIIAFGDSLSDGGTYPVGKGGGKFTTNPGKLWVEIVADKYKLPLSPNRNEGFGSTLKLLGGTNYAQGGARLTNPLPGGAVPSATARSIEDQLGYFTAEHTSFAANDLVLLQGGANDLFLAFRAVGAGKIPASAAISIAETSAGELATLTLQIEKNGAPEVVVLNLPALDQTPLAFAQSATGQQLLKTLTQTFNARLAKDLMGKPNVVLVDLHAFDQAFIADFKKQGFVDVKSVACDINSLPNKSSLFCTASTLVKPKADMTYKFADHIHPTTGYSKFAADFILDAILKAPARVP